MILQVSTRNAGCLGVDTDNTRNDGYLGVDIDNTRSVAQHSLSLPLLFASLFAPSWLIYSNPPSAHSWSRRPSHLLATGTT